MSDYSAFYAEEFMREHRAMLESGRALSARLCPHCGQPLLIAETPAQPEEEAATPDDAPPSGWREREPLL